MAPTQTYFDVPRIESIQDMLVQSASRYGDRPALRDLQPTPIGLLTHRTLLDAVVAFGSALRRAGLPERAHLAILSENRAQWMLAYLALQCYNAVAVPIDKNLSDNEVLNILHESDAVGVIYSDVYAPLIADKAKAIKSLKWFISMDIPEDRDGTLSMRRMIEQGGAAPLPMPVADPSATAVIVFTSGSLGRAKGVQLSQRNLASNLMDMTSMVRIVPEDRFLSVLPIHHTYECTCGQLCPLYCGASVHYARSLKTIVDDLQQVKATVLLGVPLLYDKMYKRIMHGIRDSARSRVLVPPLIRLTNALQRVGMRGLKRSVFKELHHKFGGAVRLFIAGGAAPDPLVAKGLRELGFTFLQGYGLTETSPILALNRVEQIKDDAAGLPLPHVELRIDQPDGDGIGEVWARGPNVMCGYYKNPDATASAFSGDWFRTGDLGYIDADGFLHIAGRKKNVIISASGKNVFPEEIEDLLNRSPYILESFVFGRKDPKQKEIVAAQIVVDAETFISLSQSKGAQITPELIHDTIAKEIEIVNRQLASHKRIKAFVVREQEFEKTTTQKIKRYLVERD
jgi:long-chain acyl-CoA synthetase